MGNFLFDIKDGVLNITASDSENYIIARNELINSDDDFSFAVENKTLLESLKSLPEQVLDFEIDNNVLTVKYLNGRFNIPVLTKHDYPTPKSIDEDAVSFTIGAELLYDVVSRSLFAVANDELRPVLNGICFNRTNDYMDVVATDGHVLARNRLFDFKTDSPNSFVLPQKPSLLLKSFLQKSEGEITVKFDKSYGSFVFDDYTMIFRFIEGRYPNYNSVIPQNNPNVAEVSRQTLLGVIKRVLPFSSVSNLVKVSVASTEMTLNAENYDFSMTASEKLPCSYDGNPMNIGFKGSAFTSLLNVLNTENVLLQMHDATRAAIVTPKVQKEGEECVLLIMPMLIND